MALETLKPNTQVVEEEIVDETTKEGALPSAPLTPAASKSAYSLGKVSGPVGVDSSILERMQQLLAEKEREKNSWVENIYDASAAAMAPELRTEALKARDAVKEKRNTDIFQIEKELAGYKVAQEKQARFEERRAKELGLGGTDGAPAKGSIPKMPSYIRTALSNASTEEEYKKIYNDWASKTAQQEANVEMDVPKIPVTAIDKDGNPYRKIISVREYRENPGLYKDTPDTKKAVEKAAPAVAAPAAPTEGKGNVPVSVRNNNPGNLVDQKTGKFIVFDTPEEGEAALDADVEAKLSNKSASYKRRFGDLPVTPARLTETWAPAKAIGNTPKSTNNYSAEIAKELGIGTDDVIPNTPEAIEAVKRVITRVESGIGRGDVNAPAATTATTATPVTTPATPKPMGRRPEPHEIEQQEKVRQSYQEKLATGSAEDIIAQQKIFTQQTEPKSVAERITSSERVVDIVNKHPNAVGLLASPGIMNALATIARDGVNTPSGAIGIKTIEDALLVSMPGSSKALISARKEIAQNLARNALEASKLSQGQGTVSDFERTMFEKIAGSLSDTPEMLVKRQQMLLHRARLDKELGLMYRQSGKKGLPKDYAEFMDSPAVQAKIDKYETQLRDTLASEVKLSGKKPTNQSTGFEDKEKEKRYQEWKAAQDQKKGK